MKKIKRRTFMQAVSATGAVSLMGVQSLLANEKVSLTKGDVILFQGDSITDAGREKKSPQANQGLGKGYPKFIAHELNHSYPDLELQIHNRGISGNKVPDLARRWQTDCIALQPKILSILIGVNDIWHKLNGRYDGTSETYRDGLSALLAETRQALPQTKLVICEPFVLQSGTVKANHDRWFPEFSTRQKFAKEVAEEAGAIWVPFQSMFDAAVAAGTKPSELAGDGVHPTEAGHQLMASKWREVVGI